MNERDLSYGFTPEDAEELMDSFDEAMSNVGHDRNKQDDDS